MPGRNIIRPATILLLTHIQLPTRLELARTMSSISIPKIMKGVLMTKPGGPEVLQYKTDLPVPIPRAGEVLVKNDFIGINYVDMSVNLLLAF